jgi:hypothetical protein
MNVVASMDQLPDVQQHMPKFLPALILTAGAGTRITMLR